MSFVTTGLVALTLLTGVAPAYAATTTTSVGGCARHYSVHDHKRFAKKVYTREAPISKRASARLTRMRKCQFATADRVVVRRLQHQYAKHRKARIIRARRREYNVGYVLPWYIVKCESGGVWTKVNYNNPNRPAGAYQIITSTWVGYGGGKYAATADAATPREQNVIGARIWNGGAGAGQWACA